MSSPHPIFQLASYLTLSGAQLLSKPAVKRACTIIRGSLLLMELVPTAVAAVLRTINEFFPGLIVAVVPFQLFGLLAHFVISTTFVGWNVDPERRLKAAGFMALLHAPSFLILIMFTIMIGLDCSPNRWLAYVITVAISVCVAALTVSFAKNGFCY